MFISTAGRRGANFSLGCCQTPRSFSRDLTSAHCLPRANTGLPILEASNCTTMPSRPSAGPPATFPSSRDTSPAVHAGDGACIVRLTYGFVIQSAPRSREAHGGAPRPTFGFGPRSCHRSRDRRHWRRRRSARCMHLRLQLTHGRRTSHVQVPSANPAQSAAIASR
jgi:hypothetical protein